MKQARIQEVDIAKGMACLLMLAAHLLGGKLLPASTFAAPLFFACSGMNVVLLLARTVASRRHDLLHVLFPLVLFFGGTTQVAIAHGGRWLLVPEFLQFIALAMLLLFALAKLLKDPHRSGWLFPVPFIIQQLLPASLLQSLHGSPLAFLFGRGFALFPWMGFVLFGVFILGLGKVPFRALQAALLAAAALSYAVAGIPLSKFDMSLSYIFFALGAITLAFSLARAIARRAESLFFGGLAGLNGRRPLGGLAGLFALPGRNSLMFVYLHYFAMRFFAMANFIPSAFLMVPLQALYLFLLCSLLLKFYEKVKVEKTLFFPSLAMAAVLAGLSRSGLLKLPVTRQMADIAVGVLFAFLYVQWRRRAAATCDRLDRSGA